MADDLSVEREGEIVRISRAGGLTLSPAWAVRDKEEARLGGGPQAVPVLETVMRAAGRQVLGVGVRGQALNT